MSQLQSDNEKMLTVKQVADEMNVDEKTVRRWIQRGDLIAVDIGRKRHEYRISRTNLSRFKSERETGHREEPI
jgi:excisionase family DNA binding protein